MKIPVNEIPFCHCSSFLGGLLALLSARDFIVFISCYLLSCLEHIIFCLPLSFQILCDLHLWLQSFQEFICLSFLSVFTDISGLMFRFIVCIFAQCFQSIFKMWLVFCIFVIDIFLCALLFYFEVLCFLHFVYFTLPFQFLIFLLIPFAPISLFAFYLKFFSKHFVFDYFSSDLICIFHLFILFLYNYFCRHYTFLFEISFIGLLECTCVFWIFVLIVFLFLHAQFSPFSSLQFFFSVFIFSHHFSLINFFS